MQNSVLTKLKQAGFSAELIDFLLQFYIGAVNVYGIISLDDLYDLFQKIKEHNAAYPEITSESSSALANLRAVNQELIILFIILQFLTNIPSKLTIR